MSASETKKDRTPTMGEAHGSAERPRINADDTATPPGEPPTTPPVAAGGLPASTGGPQQAGGVMTAVEEDTRPHRKICLVGYTTSKEEAPWGDSSWELWAMNNLHKQLGDRVEQFSRWYDVHLGSDPVAKLDHPDSEGPDHAGDRAHLAWLREPHPFPIYVIDPYQGVDVTPDGEPMPTVAERFGFPSVVALPVPQILSQHIRYFTNTVSWQIAHAILEALHDESYLFTDLSLVGIDMATGTEYAQERPSVEYFLGLATGLGVNIHLPASSDLLKAPFVYGDDEQYGPMQAKAQQRLRELHEQKDKIETMMENGARQHAAICGAIDSFAYMQGVWLPPKASVGSRDKVIVPAGSVSPVAQMLAEGEQRDRHAKET